MYAYKYKCTLRYGDTVKPMYTWYNQTDDGCYLGENKTNNTCTCVQIINNDSCKFL